MASITGDKIKDPLHPVMKPFFLLIPLCAASLWAQQPVPSLATAPWAQLPDDAKIAMIDGQPLTMGQFKAFTSFLDPRAQSMVMTDPSELIRELALMRKLAALALEQKLDQQSPAREQLEYNQMVILSQAAGQYVANSPTVDSSEILVFYNTHKESFKQVKVKAIYIPFTQTPEIRDGKKSLSEAEAKAKAARLLAAIRGGADFVKLVHENSEDETSKARNGDFATVTPNDNIPDALRAAVFQLKEGETSEPVRQANGFYLLRADQVSYLPLSQVRDQIFTKIKQDKGTALLDKMHRELDIEFPNPLFPGKSAGPVKGQ
jgi:peptidyl-prolyl cis-trans isomerase C